MKRGGYLKRKTRLERKTRVRAVNPERRARRRAEQFSHQAERCRIMRCCACGRRAPSDPAHIRSRGAGGRDRANVVPLCRTCHSLQHAIGIKTFQARIQEAQPDFDLITIALVIAAQLESEGVTWK